MSIASSLLNVILKPGMALMRRMNFRTKMLVMGTLLTVPLAWLTLHSVGLIRDDLQATRAEQKGATIAARTLDIATLTQTHRGLVNRTLAGDGTAEAPLADIRAKLGAQLKDMAEWRGCGCGGGS